MGALDPHMHKRNQLSLPGSLGEVARAAVDPGQHIQTMDEVAIDLWPSFATSEDYYSTVGYGPQKSHSVVASIRFFICGNHRFH